MSCALLIKSRYLRCFSLIVLCFNAAPVLGQTLGTAPESSMSLWRVFAVFLLCVILALAGAFVMRGRHGRGKYFSAMVKQRRMAIVESMQLPNQAVLSIVSCDGRELLVATSPHGQVQIQHVAGTDGHVAIESEPEL